MKNRRDFLKNVFGVGAGIVAAPTLLSAQHQASGGATSAHHVGKQGADKPAGPPVLVETPDLPNLPFELDGDVKVFHLVAEPVKRELIPGRMMEAWGYNGTTPGPTIQVTQGDRVRIILDNHLPEPTTMHWHGFEIPVQMDGMPYISQKPIPPGGRFVYEFPLHQEGTFFYHSHGAMQEMLGLTGMFIMHPERAYTPRVDHDFGIFLQGWAIQPNNTVPNSAGMEFNWLTFNGKAGPATTPMLVRLGDRVRIRIVNLGMDHHPIHLHGHTFAVTGTEGGRQPEALWGPGNTVLVGVAQARAIEFVADNPGDWMFHCHLPHHIMNSMMDLLSERMIPTTAFEPQQAENQMQLMAATGFGVGAHGGHGTEMFGPVSPNATQVPGFPQDVFMEMPMDTAVAKPETYGLAEKWTAGMMGMMSLVRVLKPEMYDKIMAMRREPAQNATRKHDH
jgi:FtsP/CotA-like multicopper oxidase with cupredoxin domain